MDTATRRELKNLLRRGEDALVRRDYERASTYFRRAYTADPGNIAAITNLGYSYARMGRFTHAQKCFITALDIDPDNQVARKNLSLLMKPDKGERSSSPVSGQRKSGEELFIRYMQWGNLQMEQKNFYAAIQYFREASRIHPDFIEPYLKIGMGFEELGEYAKAAGSFSDALDIFPKDPIALNHLDRCRGLADEREFGDENIRSSRYDTGIKAGEPVPASYSAEYPLIHHLSEQKPSTVSNQEITAMLHPEPASHPNPGQPQEQPGPGSPSALPSGPEQISKPASAKPTDDEVIRSILNQYSDLINSGKPEGKEIEPDQISDKGTQNSQQAEPSVSSPSPAPPVSSDDIVSSILMQYQEDLEPATAPEHGEYSPAEIPHTGDAPLSGEGTTMTNQKKDGIHVELSDDQKDALRELGNIGASHAATTLSTMLNTPIMLNVPEISITNFTEISSQIPMKTLPWSSSPWKVRWQKQDMLSSTFPGNLLFR